jgi:transposase
MRDLLMGIRDARRLGLVEAAHRGEITSRQGAEALGISTRQFKRLRQRFRAGGAGALRHRGYGRRSPQRLEEDLRRRVVEWLTHPRTRLNDCHVSDLMAEAGHPVSPATVRRIRLGLGLAPKQRRRPPQHRRRREREAQAGSMVLIDGSPFRWLGSAQAPLTLIGTVDDATGAILALRLRPGEDLHGYTQALQDTLLQHGVPRVFYGDHTSIAVRNDDHWSLAEQLAGRRFPPQFGRMLEELGIRYLAANSPEAKGRIERLWRTLQDRLAAELALESIDTRERADAFLPRFIERHNRRFARPARQTRAAWLRVPRHLERILACRYSRTVAPDNTVRLSGALLQIPPGPYRRSYQGCRVEVRELLDGRRLVLYQDRVLLEQPAPAGAFTLMSHDRKKRQNRALHSQAYAVTRREPVHAVDKPPSYSRLGPIHHPPPEHPWKRRPYKPRLHPTRVAATPG